jgi:CHAD domain-containing protein
MTGNAEVPLLHITKQYRGNLRKAWKEARRSLKEDKIHDLRVAARRTGVALRLLESVLEARHASKARRKIRKVMKRLGYLRDIQVQITAVEKWKPSDNARRFLESLKQAERRERKRAHNYLSSDRRRAITHELRLLGRRAKKRLKTTSPEALKAKVESALNLQRMNLQVATEGIQESAPESLHRLRTAARKLRYALEASADTVGAAPAEELGRLRDCQTQLGQKRDLQLLNAKFRRWKHERAARKV